MVGKRFACALAIIAVASAARAELVVLKSDADGWVPGQVVADDVVLTLAAGTTVTLMSAGGEIVTLEGPHDGPVSMAAGDIGAAQLVSELLQGRRGGTSVLGAIRGDPGGNGAAMDPLRDQIYCVVNGTEPAIALPPRSYERVLKLDGPKSAEIAWPPSQTEAAWPSGLPIAQGSTYRVSLEGVEIGAVELRTVKTANATPGAAIAALAERGCERQAIALIDGLP